MSAMVVVEVVDAAIACAGLRTASRVLQVSQLVELSVVVVDGT